MRRQRPGRDEDSFVLWDYHVAALVIGAEAAALVFDLDTRLSFPCPATDWLSLSFPADSGRFYPPLFRLVPAREYVANLASDRSHMRAPDGAWLAPPPPWEPYGAGRPNNLHDWIDMDREGPGIVLDRGALARRLDPGPARS
jgi:hypothetical protein